jgi:uncharacterized membrane protein
MKYPSWLFGIGSILAGLFDLIWGQFEPAHQPIQAWGDHIPGLAILARIAAVWLIVGGLALFIRPAARTGAVALAVLYAIFCLFPLPRFITAPHHMGHHAFIYIGVFLSIGQQVIVFIGALLLWMSFSAERGRFAGVSLAARWLFGLCCIDFGLAHFTFSKLTAAFIPAWIPVREFWAIFTGIAFVVAGLAIITRMQDVLAARLTALMLFLFSVLVLTPRIFPKPHDHVSWGADAYNLTAAGAAWILAAWLERECAAGIQSARSVFRETASA